MTKHIPVLTAMMFSITMVLSGGAVALQQDSNVTVGASVIGSCTITAGTNLTFTDYTAGGTSVDGSTDVSVNCTDGTSYDVLVDQGQNYSGGRRMNQGGNFLTYEIYTDGTYATVWDATNFQEGTGSAGGPSTHTIYGRIDASQSVPPGTYEDTLQVSVVW